MRKAINYMQNSNGILLCIYMFIIIYLNSFSYNLFNDSNSRALILCGNLNSVLLIFVALIIICPNLIKFLKSKTIKSSVELSDTRKKTFCFLSFFLTSFSVFLFCFFVTYPGRFSLDSISQFKQAVTGIYNNWHPALHTILAIKLPMILTGNWHGSIIFFQIIAFATAISYAAYSIRIYTNKRYAVIAFVYILINPNTIDFSLYVWKDSTFSVLALFLLTFAMNIYFTKGQWLKKPINFLTFLIIIVIETIVRHNAILFTAPLLFAVLFFISKKRAIALILSFIVLVFSVKGPLCTYLDVQQPDSRHIETLGLPMNVIGAVVKYDYESLDEESKIFADKIASKEVWGKYTYGDYNAVKFQGEPKVNNNVIEEYGTAGVLRIMFNCFKASPLIALRGLVALTEPVYVIHTDYRSYISSATMILPDGLEFKGNRLLENLLIKAEIVMNLVFPQLYLLLGVAHLLLIASILSKCKLNKLKSWKTILLILPVFAYNFGSMLLLTSRYDCSRFFNYTFIVLPILITILYSKNRETEVEL